MRRSFVTVGLALVGALVSAKTLTAAPLAQDPAAPAQQQAAAPAAPDPLKFTTDDALVIIQVTPGKGMDFENGWKQMMDAMRASDNAEIQALAGTMSLSKAAIPGQELFVLQVHGASKTLSYNWGKIIYYAGKDPGPEATLLLKTPEGGDAAKTRESADAMYKMINDAILVNGGAQQISVLPLNKIG